MQVNAIHVRQFMALWDRFDLLFQGWIPNNRILLEAFVSRLGPPLGRNTEDCGEWVDELQIELRMGGLRPEKTSTQTRLPYDSIFSNTVTHCNTLIR